MKFTDSELATILAALRYYQAEGMAEHQNRSMELNDVATNFGKVSALDDTAIDELCQKLNQ